MTNPSRKSGKQVKTLVWDDTNNTWKNWNGFVSHSFDIGEYDYVALTYVSSGNGIGEIETAIYKLGGSGGTTVGTLTIAYNADNEISSITKT